VFNPLKITIAWEWQKVPTDNSLCCECETVIKGQMWQSVCFVNYESTETNIKVCERCYDTSGERLLPTQVS
jgi:hypothetical protein